MPSGKLKLAEHWEMAARELEVQRLEEEGTRLEAQKQMLEAQYQQVEAFLSSLPKRKAEAILLRDAMIKKIGERLKAEGEVESWSIKLDPESPKESELFWGEPE